MDRDFLLGIFIGAMIGAVIGMAYAPRPGTETRIKWAAKSRETADRLTKTASSMIEKAAEVEETLKQAI